MRIKILGKEYTVSLGVFDTHTQMGGSNYFTQNIVLKDDLCQDSLISTLVHELVHIINTDLDLNLDEAAVIRLSSGLSAILLDNARGECLKFISEIGA
jgi:hypothetical protein